MPEYEAASTALIDGSGSRSRGDGLDGGGRSGRLGLGIVLGRLAHGRRGRGRRCHARGGLCRTGKGFGRGFGRGCCGRFRRRLPPGTLLLRCIRLLCSSQSHELLHIFPGLFRYLFRRFARAATLAFGLSFLVVRLGRSGCDVFAFGSFLLGVFARTTRLAPFGVPVFRRFLFFLPDAGYTDSLLVEYFVNKFLFGH